MPINVLSPVNSTGYGLTGLNLILELEKLGHEPAWWPIGQVDAPQEHAEVLRRANERTRSYDVNAPSLRVWHQFDLAQHVGRGKRVAFTIFELDRLKPAERHHVASMDMVIVPSLWAVDVLTENGASGERVDVAPLGVDWNIFHDRFLMPAPTTTSFLNVGKWEVRKGHDILKEAFEKAFTPDDDVHLTMACYNPCFPTREKMEVYNRGWVTHYKSGPMAEHISILPNRLASQQHVAMFMGSADCGVFPARAEGWNLELAEMLAMGRHCIATNYSGHTAFADGDHCRLIEVDELEEAYDGEWFDPERGWDGEEAGRWAKLGASQVDQLVEHMRAVHREKQEGRLSLNQKGIEMMSRHSWERTAEMVARYCFRD